MNRRILLGTLLTVLALLAYGRPPPAQAAPTIVTLDIPDSSGTYGVTAFTAINDGGEILGGDTNGGYVLTNALTLKPKPRALACPDAEFPGVNPEAINRAGEVVGNCGGAAFFLNRARVYQVFRYPGSDSSAATGINNQRQIVGTHDFGSPQDFHGFRYEKGQFTALEVSLPGNTGTVPTGINHTGTVVGYYRDDQRCSPTGDGCFHGFVLQGGVFEQLDVPIADTETLLFGLNDHGHVLGYMLHGPNGDAPFMYLDGTFYAIHAPGPPTATTMIHGINNRFQMVGQMYVFDAANTGNSLYTVGVLSQWDKREAVPLVPAPTAAGATMMATRTLLSAAPAAEPQDLLCASLQQPGLVISAKLKPLAQRCRQGR